MPAGVSARTPLANITLGSAQTSVTFSSISGSYRDLIIVASFTIPNGSSAPTIRINNDSGANYSWNIGYSNGTTVTRQTNSSDRFYVNAIDLLATSRAIMTVNIMDYSQTNKHKTLICRSDSHNSETSMLGGRWNSSAAITSVILSTSLNQFGAGSTFALYGVSA